MMKKYLIFLIIILSFNVNAQMSKAKVNEGLNLIYENYNKGISVINDKLNDKYESKFSQAKTNKEKEILNIEYKKDYDFYQPEAKALQTKKIEELKSFIKKIETLNPRIGKKKISDNSVTSSKDEVQIISNAGNISNQELNDLRKAFADSFRSDYIDYDSVLKTNLRIIIDSDGYLKNITASGSNEEFNYLSIITLYSLNKKFKPLEQNGYYILSSYQLPISLNIE